LYIHEIRHLGLVGLRRALIGVMTYAFARIGAAVAMQVEDYFAKRQALVGPPPRERRQAPRNAGPPKLEAGGRLDRLMHTAFFATQERPDTFFVDCFHRLIERCLIGRKKVIPDCGCACCIDQFK
jgi:hypothetical protein